MITKNSIDAKTSKHVSKILAEEPEPTSRAAAKEVIDYYVKNYPNVQLVSCNKCGSDLCLEVLSPTETAKYAQSHHQAMRRIELEGSTLLSSRKRLDGVMGYRCRCGNNTINSTIELGLLPSVDNPIGPASIPVIEPHHEAAVKLAIANGKYKPDVEVNGDTTRIETFSVRKIK